MKGETITQMGSLYSISHDN